MPLLADDRLALLAPGDHACAIYGDRAEQAEAMVRYVRTGLDRGERCIYIADDRTGVELSARLACDGVDVGAVRAANRLRLLSSRETYLRDGQFCPLAMIALLTSAEREALDAGCTGLRVSGEMTWALDRGTDNGPLMEYEAALNAYFPGSRSHAVCQYHRAPFCASVIREVLRTHPIAIVGSQVCPNPYYEPSDVSRPEGASAPDAAIDWMIDRLVALRASELRLQEAIEARDEFLSSASHELRTPLNALCLAVRAMAVEGADPRHIARLERQIERVNRLVDVTFEVSRLREHRRSLRPEPCALRATVAEVVRRFEADARDTGSDIVVDVEEIVGLWDRYALEQIVACLVSNALKFAGPGVVEISGAADGAGVWLRVRDNGPGIPPEHRARIFDRFDRGGLSSRSSAGLGVGLWLVREYTAGMGGSVRLASVPGEGCMFEVSLPLETPNGDDPGC